MLPFLLTNHNVLIQFNINLELEIVVLTMDDNTVDLEVDTQSSREAHRCSHCGNSFAFKNSLKVHTEKRRCLKESKIKQGGKYCSAVKCNNSANRDGPRGIKFYRFPNDTIRRKRWTTLVNRTQPNGSPWYPGPDSRLCSEHFVSSKKSDNPDDPDYEPSVFVTNRVKPNMPSESDLACKLQNSKIVLPEMDLKEIDPPSVCQVMLDSTTENLEEKLKVLRNLKKGKELPCPHGCTDKMFKSQAYLRYHLKSYHSGVPKVRHPFSKACLHHSQTVIQPCMWFMDEPS